MEVNATGSTIENFEAETRRAESELLRHKRGGLEELQRKIQDLARAEAGGQATIAGAARKKAEYRQRREELRGEMAAVDTPAVEAAKQREELARRAREHAETKEKNARVPGFDKPGDATQQIREDHRRARERAKPIEAQDAVWTLYVREAMQAAEQHADSLRALSTAVAECGASSGSRQAALKCELENLEQEEADLDRGVAEAYRAIKEAEEARDELKRMGEVKGRDVLPERLADRVQEMLAKTAG